MCSRKWFARAFQQLILSKVKVENGVATVLHPKLPGQKKKGHPLLGKKNLYCILTAPVFFKGKKKAISFAHKFLPGMVLQLVIARAAIFKLLFLPSSFFFFLFPPSHITPKTQLAMTSTHVYSTTNCLYSRGNIDLAHIYILIGCLYISK